MNYPNNDTINASQQNKKQSMSDKAKIKDAMTAKLLASAAAGLIAGIGATNAAENLTTEEEPLPMDEPTPQKVETLAEQLPEEETMEDVIIEQEQPKQNDTNENPHLEPEPEPNPDEDVVEEEHDMQIESVEVHTLEDGTNVHVYLGTVDGHNAAFLANESGNIVATIVDENDNGEVDEAEITDISDNKLASLYLASCQIPVIGQTVDVIQVEPTETVTPVDANQNEEVNIIAANDSHISSSDDNTCDVTSATIANPTEEDATGIMTASVDNVTEDYMNDADVTVYDV